MLVTCPRCKRSLSTAEREGPPSFCMYCGQKLRDSGTAEPGDMLTASHVPFGENPEEDAEPPPNEVGGYRLLRFLGAGGMGAVYEGESAESGQHVAVKLLSKRLASNPASVERFRQEGRLASQLAHPRSVFVLAADTDAGRPYIVMELMPGRTLKDLIDRDGALPPHEAIAYVLDALDGLAEAHRLGMIHRDVKPSNCFLTTDNRVKVGDFGLSKSLAAVEDHHLTQSGAFVGTVLFASPEQIRGEPLDYASDIYSLCATLYFLLCGEAPYHHESATAALAKAISEPPPPICPRQPAVSRALERVVMRGLERDRERRWQSLDDLREALVDLLPSRQTPARPRAIVGAYLLDLFILILTVGFPLEILHSLLQWGHVRVAGMNFDPVWWAFGIAYFATFEGLLGRTPGKWLLGLRVNRVGQSGPPGLERGWIRALTFILVMFWTTYAPPLLSAQLGGAVGLAALVLGLFAILSQLRRTAEGYRGVHDFVSGCQVTQKPLPVRRLRLYSRLPNPLEQLLPANEAEPVPNFVGGYSVKGRIWTDAASGQEVWSAEDRALSRRVLIWLMPDDGNPMTPIASDVPRLTRLRRIGRGVIRWANRDLEWVAFAAPVGAPLSDAIRRPLPWADGRFLIEQLVEELHAAEADGSTPSRLSLNQIWVEPNGRLQLLDFPIPGSPQVTATPLALIRETTTLALEGSPRSAFSTRTDLPGVFAPVPPHAAPILNKLFAQRSYATLGELQNSLRETHAHPPEVTPVIRAGHLGIQAGLLSFGLMMMFGITGILSIVLTKLADGQVKLANDTLADLRDPLKHEELKRMGVTSAALDNPRATARIESVRQHIQTEASDRRDSLLAPQRHFLHSIDQAMDSTPQDPDRLAEHDLLVWAAANEKTLTGRGASPWKYQTGPFWAVLIAVPLLWIAAAAIFRGGVSMLIAGIAVVRADGRRAYRPQCLFRAALVWTPIGTLLWASAWLQIYQFRMTYFYVGLWLAAGGLLLVYAFLALRYPSRPPQDRIAGTYLVPV